MSLSIAHSERFILAALGDGAGSRVGADLTPIGAVTTESANLWFTEGERSWIARGGSGERPRASAIVWAVKEAFYKATNDGERFTPLAVEVTRGAEGEYSVEASAVARFDAIEIRIEEQQGEIAALVIARRVQGASHD